LTHDDSRDDIGAALSRIPSGVAILTAVEGPTATGMLASWIQQAAFDPPMLTVCVREDRPILRVVDDAGGSFALNVLGEDSAALLKHFAKGFSLDENAFEGLAIHRREQGVRIDEAIAYLECRLESTVWAGDHRLMLGRVVYAEGDPSRRPYVHVRKTGLSY